MYPFKIAFDWTEEELKELSSLNTINLLDSTDKAYEMAKNISLGNGITTIVLHGKNNGKGLCYGIFNEEGNKSEIKDVDIEELAEYLVDSGKWNCADEVVLLACNAGTNTILSPAQELADCLQSLVWAPLGTVYFLINGKFVVAENNLNSISKYMFEYEYQRKMWRDFLPITY